MGWEGGNRKCLGQRILSRDHNELMNETIINLFSITSQTKQAV